MTKEKARTIGYWVTTILGPTSFVIGGVINLMRTEQAVATLQHLGYPAYFASILGAGKLLGAIVITIPGVPRLKEWAYAGFFIDLTAAAISRAAVGDSAADIIAPLGFLALVLASWALRPADRKLAAPAVPGAPPPAQPRSSVSDTLGSDPGTGQTRVGGGSDTSRSDPRSAHGSRATAVFTCRLSSVPVHANTSSFPRRAMRGYPLLRLVPMSATTIAADRCPDGSTRRTLKAAFPSASSIHDATADPSSSSSRSTLPSDPASSTRIGAPKVRPASCENATNAWPRSFWTVNHATATVRPAALTAGPFTGHPSICHPSSWTGAGVLHLPSTSLAT